MQLLLTQKSIYLKPVEHFFQDLGYVHGLAI